VQELPRFYPSGCQSGRTPGVDRWRFNPQQRWLGGVEGLATGEGVWKNRLANSRPSEFIEELLAAAGGQMERRYQLETNFPPAPKI